MKGVLLRVLVSVFFIGLLVFTVRKEIPMVLETLKGVRFEWVLAAIGLHGLSTFLLAKRLELIYEVQETPLPFTESVNITYVGFLFNNFLPTSVGGDLVKAYCGFRITGQKLKSFTAVLMDRLFGLFVFVLIPSVTVVFIMKGIARVIPVAIFSTLALAVCAGLLLFSKRVARKFGFVVDVLDRFGWGERAVMLYEGLHHFRHHKKMMLEVMALSLCAQLLGIGAVYLLIRSLGGDVNPLYLLLATPVVHLMSMLPSINGLGVRETGFVYFFKGALGVHSASALAVLYFFLLFVMSLIGGLIYLFRPDYHFRMKDVESAEKSVEAAHPVKHERTQA